MGVPKNIVGQRFNMLVVTGLTERRSGTEVVWLCTCDCGRTTHVATSNLRRGSVKSCGCKRASLGGLYVGHDKEYMAWYNAIQRCHDPEHPQYEQYGGRGITVCRRWRTKNGFANFLADMGPLPKIKRVSIDRIDNDKGYTPKNCRWTTSKTQANNRSNHRTITFRGRTLNVRQWSERTGIPYATIYSRLLKGWAPSRILS